MSEQVPIGNMPYRLRLSSANFASYLKKKHVKRHNEHGQLSNEPPVFYYFRVSAMNAELGEGPYSNIVELRKLDKEFDAPLNFHVKNVNSTSAVLKWDYRLDTLRYASKHFSTHMHFQHQQQQQQQWPISILNTGFLRNTHDQQELLKSLGFVVYLKSRRFYELDTPAHVHSANSDFVKWMSLTNRSFRNLTALSCLNVSQFEAGRKHGKNSASAEAGVVSFAYAMTNLYPNTDYVIEMTSRWLMLESRPAPFSPPGLKFTTLGN
jgi:hypothetical protein